MNMHIKGGFQYCLKDTKFWLTISQQVIKQTLVCFVLKHGCSGSYSDGSLSTYTTNAMRTERVHPEDSFVCECWLETALRLAIGAST